MKTKVEEYYYSAQDQVDAKFLSDGVFYLYGELEDENLNNCIKWLIYENSNHDQKKMLTLYINSQGGDLYSSLALIDMMKQSKIPIRTIGLGSVMSSAFLIFVSGTKGFRELLRNTGVMSHQFSMDGEIGKYHDIKSTRKELDRLNDSMYNVIKEATDLDGRKIKSKLLAPSDSYIDVDECIELGIADRIL